MDLGAPSEHPVKDDVLCSLQTEIEWHIYRHLMKDICSTDAKVFCEKLDRSWSTALPMRI